MSPKLFEQSKTGPRCAGQKTPQRAYEEMYQKHGPMTLLTVGELSAQPAGSDRFNVKGIVGGLTILHHRDKRLILRKPDSDPGMRRFCDESLRNAVTALEEVIYFNNPDRFVVQITNLKAKKRSPRKTGKIPRSQDRETFTFLTPRQIRETCGLEHETDGEEGKRKPHPRRRHYRTFRADRYKAAKDKTVVIEAHWVGPTETIVGNKKYKIRLDL